MNKMKNRTIDGKELATTREGLAASLHCGVATANKIGIAAGARFKIGGRVLFNLEKVQAYINSISGSGERD